MSHLRGGTFRAGMIGGFFGHMSAGLAAATSKAVGAINAAGVAVRTATAAVIGGTISWASGGKFANGATSAAFTHLFNAEGSAYNNVPDRNGALGWPNATRYMLSDGSFVWIDRGMSGSIIGRLSSATSADEAYYNSPEAAADSKVAVIGVANGLSLFFLKRPLAVSGARAGVAGSGISIMSSPVTGTAGLVAEFVVSRYLGAIPQMSPALSTRGGILANMAISNSSLPHE